MPLRAGGGCIVATYHTSARPTGTGLLRGARRCSAIVLLIGTSLHAGGREGAVGSDSNGADVQSRAALRGHLNM